nr:Na/Pi symporter [Tepidamorphus gemmatus]
MGMKLITDGLRASAGSRLRDILAVWTRTRLRGLAAGLGMTALVQSSTAVAVATIGFVNAGLLTLMEAVWIVFGSNVGTTTTAWIVAVIGLKLKLEATAAGTIAVAALDDLIRRIDANRCMVSRIAKAALRMAQAEASMPNAVTGSAGPSSAETT